MAHAISPSSVSDPYQIQVTVDTSGHISSILPEQNMRDEYIQALKKAAPQWRFAVHQVRGKPVPCTTWIRVKFSHASAVNGVSDYVAEYIGNGPYIEPTRISYPPHLYQWRISAIFYVRFVVEPTGVIDNVQLIQAWTSGGKPIGDAMQDVTKGIVRWKTKPMLVDGRPVSAQIIEPVSFITESSLDKSKPDFGMEIAGDSPNSGRPIGNIPESGAVAPLSKN